MNPGEWAESQAVAFQKMLDKRDTDPEYIKARDLQQSTCPHDKLFDCGLCARCGKWTLDYTLTNGGE